MHEKLNSSSVHEFGSTKRNVSTIYNFQQIVSVNTEYFIQIDLGPLNHFIVANKATIHVILHLQFSKHLFINCRTIIVKIRFTKNIITVLNTNNNNNNMKCATV